MPNFAFIPKALKVADMVWIVKLVQTLAMRAYIAVSLFFNDENPEAGWLAVSSGDT